MARDVGHNVSERALQARIARAARTDTPGWQQVGDGWVKDMTVAGAQLRGAQLRAVCRAHGCMRRVTADLRRWEAMGLARLALRDMAAAYRCGLTPCGLEWEAERYADGPPLMCWASVRGACVVVSCLRCRAEHRRPVATFAATLHRLGIASCNMSYRSLSGRLIRGPCRACGERAWHVRLDPTPSPNLVTMGFADLR